MGCGASSPGAAASAEKKGTDARGSSGVLQEKVDSKEEQKQVAKEVEPTVTQAGGAEQAAEAAKAAAELEVKSKEEEEEVAAKQVAEEEARREAEEQAKKEAEERAKKEEQEKARKEAEEKAQKEAEEARQRQIDVEKAEDEAEGQAMGTVTVKYNHYEKQHEIKSGRLREQDFFSLAYAMKGATLHLSDAKAGENGQLFKLQERAGTYKAYSGLEDGQVYFVIIEKSQENEETLAADRARREKDRIAQDEYEKLHPTVMPEAKAESCSCLFGNPCVDRYNCLDWENRDEVARKNGGRNAAKFSHQK